MPAIPRSKSRRSGLTLVETTLIVSIAGVVLAVFVPAFFRAVRTSKVSEAVEQLAELHRRASSYYLAVQDTGAGRAEACLPPSAGPTPSTPRQDAVSVDFQAPETPGSPTWQALGYAPDVPLRYSYSFRPRAEGCGVSPAPGQPLFMVRAQGDLDGDGELSRFERSATVTADGKPAPLGALEVLHRPE